MPFRLILLAASAMFLAGPPGMAEPARNIAAEATATCMTAPDDPSESFCVCLGTSIAEIIDDPDLYDRMQGKTGANGTRGLTAEEQQAYSEPVAKVWLKCSVEDTYFNDHK